MTGRFFAATSLLVLASCAGQQAKDTAMSMPFVMTQDENLEKQRPRLPNTDAVSWTKDDRLYGSVAIDYIEGMSNRSYVFSKPNQEVYRPMLRWALDRAGLLAHSPIDARYALQVEFIELDTEAFGLDFAGRSVANYRIVDRWTGQVAYENLISSNFLAIYPRLNEDDFAKAYDISKDIVVKSTTAYLGYVLVEGGLVELINNNDDFRDFFDDDIAEASQATWNDVTQAYVWTAGVGALLGPLEIVREQLDPTNYIAFSRRSERVGEAPDTRRGALDSDGFASRSGSKRARQAGAQMLSQSLTKFIIDLGLQENVDFVAIMPCHSNTEVERAKTALMARGIRWYAPDCSQNVDPVGLQFTRLQ